MNYDEMPAGAEMDRLVAEMVMGWPPDRITASEVRAAGKRLEAFTPSTNIAHAWEVVARLQWGFKGKRQLYLQTDGYSSEQWRASWHRPEEYVTQAEVEADTAPIAICRAALKAVSQ